MYLCCEKYYANINLQLLKIMKDVIDDEFCDGSFDYRDAAHTMLTDIIFHDVCYGTLQDEYRKYQVYSDSDSDEHSPYNNMKSVMDLLQPWDDELLEQVSLRAKISFIFFRLITKKSSEKLTWATTSTSFLSLRRYHADEQTAANIKYIF